MLDLFPIRLLLRCAFAAAGVVLLVAVYTGWTGKGEPSSIAFLLIRWSSMLAIVALALGVAVWRWVPAVQRSIFPYLGGHWSGFVRFEDEDGSHRRDVTLEIKHTLFGLRLLLDSKESTSWTLAVHAERNEDFERYRLYYVYLNERKDGFAGAGQRYRGLAVIRVESGERFALHGNYFTDTDRRGTLHLGRVTLHPWWKLWR
jgi:hypothetical protein